MVSVPDWSLPPPSEADSKTTWTMATPRMDESSTDALISQ